MAQMISAPSAWKSLGEALAGDEVELGFEDGRVVVELEPAGLELGPVAADVAGIEGDAEAFERPGGILGGGVGLVLVRERGAGAVAGGEVEGEEGLVLGDVGVDDDALVVDVGVVPEGAVDGVDLIDEAGEFLAGDGLLVGMEGRPVGRGGEGERLAARAGMKVRASPSASQQVRRRDGRKRIWRRKTEAGAKGKVEVRRESRGRFRTEG